MPPKKGASKPEGFKKQEMVDEAPLQAVVLADSYNRRFEVMCSERPRILLPFCGTPLLAWTLEALVVSKVKQVFLFCGAHADQIRSYVEQLLDIQCLSSQTAYSHGDALRELDAMGVLNGDNPFILVHSPLISNYDISRMVEAHKKLRAKDPNYIMTMGVGKGGRRHPETPVLLVHPPSRRLLHYSSLPLYPSVPRVSFPSQLFIDPYPASIDSYEIWSGTSSSTGYRDLGVDICEADVPALCTENFDYHDLRRHFVGGVLTSELLGKKIAVHLVGSEIEDKEQEWADRAEKRVGDKRQGRGGRYVERIRDTRTYADVSRDVLRRWAFPILPDLISLDGTANKRNGGPYELRPGNVYVARDDVKLALSTALKGPALVGAHSTLADSVLISQSVLGTCSAVGRSTTISQSYIFDNCRIGANCLLNECIVGEGVEIADGVEIGKGALIGDGVKLGKGVRVPEYSRVGREVWRPEGWEEGDEVEGEQAREEKRLEILGDSSEAHFWPQEEEEHSDDSDSEGEDDPYENPGNKRLLQLGRSLSNYQAGSTESLSTLSKASTSAPSSPQSLASDDSMETDSEDGMGMETSLHGMTALSLGPGSSAAFRSEAAGTLARAWDEGHAVKNLEVEFGLLVPAFNAGVDAAREEVLRFFLNKIEVAKGVPEILASARQVFINWGPIIGKYATSDRSTLAFDMQRFCCTPPSSSGDASSQSYTLAPYFGILLRAAYETDLLEETPLVKWRDTDRAQMAARGQQDMDRKKVDAGQWEEVWKRGKVYVDVLESMDSGSEEEESDEDDEESGEESD